MSISLAMLVLKMINKESDTSMMLTLNIIYICLMNFMFVTINDKLGEVSYNLLRLEIDLPDADACILATTQEVVHILRECQACDDLYVEGDLGSNFEVL